MAPAGRLAQRAGRGEQFVRALLDLAVQMVRAALDNLKTDFPTYDGSGYELAGFVWYHGWNDGVDPKNAPPSEAISRREPDLPSTGSARVSEVLPASEDL